MGFSDENFCSNAPWNDRSKKVLVRVTQTLVCDFEIEVDSDADDAEIKAAAKAARVMPDAAVVIATGDDDWDLYNEEVKVL